MTHRSNVLLLQLPVPYATAVEVTGNLPMGAASLIQHLARSTETAGVECRLLPQEPAARCGDAAIASLVLAAEPDVLGLTCTVWNVERSLALARRIKEARPATRIWLGGPEVAGDAFFLQTSDAPFDVAVDGEGEAAFAALLGGAFPESLEGIQLPNGGWHVAPAALEDLAGDPFVNGLVNLERDRVAFTEWARGCTRACSFCRYHQGRGSGQVVKARDEVSWFLNWARERDVQEVYVLDPSFEQRADFLDFLGFLARHNGSDGVPLMVELKAGAIDEETARLLSAAGVHRVETGLQTVTERALEAAGRPLSVPAFTRGMGVMKGEGIEVKVDVMVGLPGDDEDGFERTLRFLRDNEFHGNVQIFRTQVLPGTELRRRASSFAIEYDPAPPYHVLATPTWPRERLDNAFAVAEVILETSFGLEEEPPLRRPVWSEGGTASFQYPGTEAAFLKAFYLPRAAGRIALERETFVDAGTAMTLWLTVEDPHRHRGAICRAVESLVAHNPFSTLFVALAISSPCPLDVFDEVEALLGANRQSSYADEVYAPMASGPRPLRRLLALLETKHRRRMDDGWLASLRHVADVVWLVPCTSLEDGLRHVSTAPAPPSDYLFLDVDYVPEDLQSCLFENLAEMAGETDRVLLPSLELNWAYRRFLASRGGWDW